VSESKSPMAACEDLCQELMGATDTSFTRTYGGNPESRIIWQGRNLSLIADLSPLCVGHLLLVSNHHFYSFAEVCREYSEEVLGTVARVLELYSSAFGEPVILEHGSFAGMVGSACISHAHWHILPIPAELVVTRMDADGLDHVDLEGLSGLAFATGEQIPYFYVASAEYHRLYGIGRRMQQQYLRAVAGRILGIPDPQWDWALVVRKRHLRTSISLTTDWRRDL
jgi:diadenosine tetraphosphate (Ap4A) HIT family hydrolase